jgi:5-methylcytosine-specific restriction protein A
VATPQRALYTATWATYSRQFLAAHPWCGDRAEGTPPTDHSRCARLGLAVRAEVTDHITPHRGDRDLMWRLSNHQALCASCHNRKTAIEDGGFGRG